MAKTLGDITRELNEKVLIPAKAEAEAIVRNAEAQAANIVAQAQSDAEKLKSDAKTAVESAQKQFEVAMDTAARNFVIMLKEKIEAAVVAPTVEKEVRDALKDTEFLKRILEVLIAEFAKERGQGKSLELLLPKQNQKEMQEWFIKKFREKMAGSLTIHFTDKVSFGFYLGLGAEGAHFNFETGLVEAFASFCSPRFRKHFFANEE